MRTTLTLDDDVAALLDRVRKQRNLGLKEAVNDALRRGLTAALSPGKPRKPYRTPSANTGPMLIDNVDCISKALAYAEGEAYR